MVTARTALGPALASPIAIGLIGLSGLLGPQTGTASAASALPTAPAAPAPASAPLCQRQPTVFACPLPGGKQVALCGKLPGQLQYRFGTPKKLELAYPAQASEGVQRMLYAHHARAQASRTEVRFSNAGSDYTVFDYREDGARSAGVTVLHAGATQESRLECKGPVTGRLSRLAPHLACDASNALVMGECPARLPRAAPSSAASAAPR